MDYSHDDAGLARQPIGYWSWAAHEATVTHIRSALAEHGLTQPPWWVLNQLDGADEEGRGRAELVTMLSGYLHTGAAGMESRREPPRTGAGHRGLRSTAADDPRGAGAA